MKSDLILGIMQPYFFPYLGYYDLINRTNQWIVFDVVKYAPKSWMNRNRILHPVDSWQYLTVPVDKHAGDGAIHEVSIVDMNAAYDKICGQIEHYRKSRAPYFKAVARLVDECFSAVKSERLRDLNVNSLSWVCDYLGIAFQTSNLSEMDLPLPQITYAGQWALEIASQLGASAYLNPPGGRDIFRPQDWHDRGIHLEFTEMVEFPYATGRYQFVAHLSILDVLMWNSPDQVAAYLNSRKHAAQYNH
jgi:hypothetical protein